MQCKNCKVSSCKYGPNFYWNEKHSKSREAQQVQFWFCPIKSETCVLRQGCQWIVYYPSVPKKWPIMFGTNLSQAEVTSFEFARFLLEDGMPKHGENVVVPPSAG